MPSAPIDWTTLPTPRTHWSPAPETSPGPEPYLAILDRVTLTPHRSTESDISAIVDLSNRPEIARWSFRREFPYERTHALQWLLHQIPPSVRASTQLENSLPISPRHCPFNVIRLDDQLIGDCDLFWVSEDSPSSDTATVDDAGAAGVGGVEKPKKVTEAESSEGSPEKKAHTAGPGEGPGEWCLGYNLHPDHHNKGIATAAVTALIAWGREYLQVRTLAAHAEEANGPSQAVLRKLGFRKEGVETQEWPEYHGGGYRDVGVWRLDLPPAP